MRLLPWLSGWLNLAAAAKHHLFVGTFDSSRLYALEFDSTTLGLTVTANITARGAHSWLSLSHDKKALYASGIRDPSWHSYTIHNTSALTPSASIPLLGTQNHNCTWLFPLTGQYILASSNPPYPVYATAPGCMNILFTDAETGALTSIVQTIPYTTPTAFGSLVPVEAGLMHGMALSSSGHFLYGADARNSIWTYSVDAPSGDLTLVDVMMGPVPGSDPRHAATHPGGWLYVVLEGSNALAQYKLNENGIPDRKWTAYPLINERPGLNLSAYWPDEVMLSATGKYLWATNRGKVAGTKGFISAFALKADGEIERQLFIKETATSGGGANAVSPAPWGDEFVALTDAEVGFVEVWGFDGTDAKVVSRVDIVGGRCCATAVWVD
ncbi:hypothetical protein OQA88_12562 [Cercophora sp. LCS_1]